jgi:hypothetical protein
LTNITRQPGLSLSTGWHHESHYLMPISRVGCK